MRDEEIIIAIKKELRRLYGESYARATVIQPGKGGWWYLGIPEERLGQTYQRPVITRPVRKPEIETWLEELRSNSDH